MPRSSGGPPTVEDLPPPSEIHRQIEKLPLFRELDPAQLEGRADDVHNKGLKALFLASATQPMAFIVGSEIYDHLEKVMDRFEDVANEIDGLVIDHA